MLRRSTRLLDSPSVDYRAGVRGRSRNLSGASIASTASTAKVKHGEQIDAV